LGIHSLDLDTLNRVADYAHVYGFEGYVPSPTPSYWLQHEQKIQFGSIELTVLFTPGHAPGHVVFYVEKEGIVINGDVLFRGSFGRTDLPGGDMR
jgi:glyoxylase-like metal-dependent hydrolase (beta-lactamase superfamily II)